MTGIRSRQTVTPYSWGQDGRGWRLCDEAKLQVIEEELPPGTAENLHYHAKARQVYYILSGSLRVELDGETCQLAAGEMVEIPPGTRHLIANDGTKTASLLVISSPSTYEDRLQPDSDKEG
ncbi:cupin domain-containing protein [Alphaproteobacteria bacterium LSUCC0684]